MIDPMTPTGTPLRIVRIDSREAFERGVQRAVALGTGLADGFAGYLALFAAVGVREATLRGGAEQTMAATEAWCGDLVDEMRGVADASGLALWQVAALNARTEILSGASGTKPGECSTIVNVASALGAQTWDWHEELAVYWHLQEVRGTAHSYIGLTEHGILSKVGMNDAGVGIFLNILGHTADRADGVPVHLVGARVLAEAGTVAEAVSILQHAPVSTSSAITVLGGDGAVSVELSPLGAAVVTPRNGTLLHTNHFLDARLSVGEKRGVYDPDSQLRYAVLQERAARGVLPDCDGDLVDYLVSYPGDDAELCCVPSPGATLGQRWATLATITMDSSKRSMSVAPGTPLEVARGPWMRLHL